MSGDGGIGGDGGSIGTGLGGLIGGLSGIPGGSALGGLIGGQIGANGFGGNSPGGGLGPGPGFGDGDVGEMGAPVGGGFGGFGGPDGGGPAYDGQYYPSQFGGQLVQPGPDMAMYPGGYAGGGSIADQIFNLTSKLRGNYVGQLNDFSEGNFDISKNPMWSGGKSAIEDQYNVARDNVIGNMPTGGELNESLTNVDIGRAKGLTELISNIENDMMNKSYQAAFGTVPSSISSQTSTANQNALLQAQEDANDNQMMMQIGTGLAGLFSDK